jgi:hypothetical protein
VGYFKARQRTKRRGAILKIESADGAEGYLIWCGGDRYVFRIYSDAPHDFVDYDLRHCDMKVRIIEPDAFFYRDGDLNQIDHSPDTLGLKVDSR